MGLAEAARRWDEAILARRDRLWDRLRRRSPRGYRVVMTVLLVPVIVNEWLLPPRRVRPFVLALAAATVVDSLATYLWVAVLDVAEEANPYVDAALRAFGVGRGLALRTGFSLALIAVAWRLAVRRWEGRYLLLAISVPLFGTVAYHAVAGTAALLRG